MKKYIAFFAAIILITGCTALDRVNPTDPKAGNYEGLHYTGSIGSFTTISDIKVQEPNTVWCTDSVTGDVFSYKKNGDENFMLYSPNIIAPSGICADSAFFYLVNTDMTYHNLERFNPAYVTDTTVTQPPLYASIALKKCALFGTSMYLTDSNTVYVFDTSTNAMTGVSWQVSPGAAITDIKTDAGGNVIVADSSTNDILVYSMSPLPGNLTSSFQYSFNIRGFALCGSYLYIPGSGGLHKINYPALTEAQVLANYGQGNGKVDMPGPCDAFADGTILVGDVTTIKVFAP
jgi:DNA-binding beta-propeller fold protein YncE